MDIEAGREEIKEVQFHQWERGGRAREKTAEISRPVHSLFANDKVIRTSLPRRYWQTQGCPTSSLIARHVFKTPLKMIHSDAIDLF